jgi:anaerobic selenocysteine-containing dehydrogenase
MIVQKTSVCQICGCNCGLLVSLDGGQIVEVKGDPQIPQNKGGICIKGKFSPQVLYAPDRLKTPIIRRKGGTNFMSLSWDDALNEISERLEQIKHKNGPEALAIYRGRSTRFIDRTFISAFARLFGTPNVTGVWTLCVGPKVIGYKATFGAPLFPACDFRNARLIVLWGTNPSASKMHRYFNLPNDIRNAIREGAELVIVDPRRHRFADEATLHLPITPGTDTYLILSLVKILIEHGWTDDTFIKTYTSGYERLCDAAKKVDILEASQITGIPSETIMELAKKLGTIKPASIDRREGVIHQVNGTQINRALAILAAITGNVDRSGGLRFTALPSWDTSLGIEDNAKVPSIWSQRYPWPPTGPKLSPIQYLSKIPIQFVL